MHFSYALAATLALISASVAAPVTAPVTAPVAAGGQQVDSIGNIHARQDLSADPAVQRRQSSSCATVNGKTTCATGDTSSQVVSNSNGVTTSSGSGTSSANFLPASTNPANPNLLNGAIPILGNPPSAQNVPLVRQNCVGVGKNKACNSVAVATFNG
ncbi:MAG: hypothetical protein M1825_004910 [Sarcosagium campestre]|nr:MAG: hypothetical protein M1825_004910 [Sarcosagium campestre]